MAFPWRDTFEYTHGYVHMAFGTNSQMSDILCSPFDPMFISHHAFVEKMCDTARVRLRGRSGYPDINSLDSSQRNSNVRAAAASNCRFFCSFFSFFSFFFRFCFSFFLSDFRVDCFFKLIFLLIVFLN